MCILDRAATPEIPEEILACTPAHSPALGLLAFLLEKLRLLNEVVVRVLELCLLTLELFLRRYERACMPPGDRPQGARPSARSPRLQRATLPRRAGDVNTATLQPSEPEAGRSCRRSCRHDVRRARPTRNGRSATWGTLRLDGARAGELGGCLPKLTFSSRSQLRLRWPQAWWGASASRPAGEGRSPPDSPVPPRL